MDNIQKNFRDKSRLRGMAAPKQGLVDGGKVKGKGGPTDDMVGPVALSDGEYVLPADTVEIVGRDNLDALRLATHEFVDDSNKPKVSGLRRMANGGPFYVDPEGVASRQRPPGRAVVPYQQPPAPATVTAPQATAATGPAATGPAATGPAAPARPSMGSRLRGAAGRGVAGTAGALTASDGVGSMVNEGVNATNVGDTAAGTALLAQAVGRGNPVTGAAATGWMAGRAIGDNMSRDAQDAVGGTINNIVRGTGQTINRGLRAIGVDTEFGSDWGEDDSYYLQNKYSGGAPQMPGRVLAQQPSRQNAPQIRTSEAGPVVGEGPGSYQSLRLAEMGVPVDQQNTAPVTEDTRRALLRQGGGTPGEYTNLGSFGGDANIYGTASEPGGRINSFVGVGANARPGSENQGNTIPGSVLRGGVAPATTRQPEQRGGGRATYIGPNDIDRRYDEMAKQLRGMYSEKGQGNLARRLLQLEEQRMNAHNALMGNQTTLRGQDIEAETSRTNAALQAETSRANSMDTLARGQDAAMARVREAQLKALQDAQRQARDSEEKGFNRYTDAISRMFVNEDGETDAREQELFTSFLESSDPQAFEKFAAMRPQDQMVLLQNFKTLYDMNKGRNETARRGGGAVTNRADLPVDVREATWDDYWNNNLPLSDYLWAQWTPFTNPNVVVGESGQPVLLSDIAVDENGNWDADKLDLIQRRTGRSGLRN